MKRLFLFSAILVAMLPMSAAAADSAPQTQSKAAAKKSPAGPQIYGSQLMTPQERDAYRAQTRGAKTQAERNQIRAEHHAAMQQRAKEKGVTLPAEPRGPRAGAGPGKGPGPGPQR